MKCILFTLLVGLISSNRYQRVAGRLVPTLKEVIQIRFSLYKILRKIQTKKERLIFLKTLKARFQENFDFRGFIETLLAEIQSPEVVLRTFHYRPIFLVLEWYFLKTYHSFLSSLDQSRTSLEGIMFSITIKISINISFGLDF